MITKKRIRLAMILKGFPRISESFISNEILLLEKAGIKIELFSMRQPRESFCHPSVGQISAVPFYLPESLLSGISKFFASAAKVAGQDPPAFFEALRTAALRMRRTRRALTLKHLLQAGMIAEEVKKRKITHIHAHFAHSPASVAMFASILSKIPFSFTAHAKDIYTSDPVQLAEKIKKARFVLTCTGYNRRYLKKTAGRTGTPIHLLYHGIDTRLFSPPKEANTAPVPPYRILTVARLTAKKGIATIIRALYILKSAGIAFTYTLVGDGEQKRNITGLIRSFGLEGNVKLTGTLDHEKVIEHYKRADLFVLGCEIADNGDRDGIPNVIAESMAMGVPVVATDISAIPEIVENKKTGLLVSPSDPGAMARAMLLLLTGDRLRGSIIERARMHVSKNFDNRVLAKRLVEIYEAGMP